MPQGLGQSLPRRERIAKRSDFLLAYESGSKRFTRFTVLFTRPQDLGHPRIGITATRKLGKANVRNKFRRWVRETYRINRNEVSLDRLSMDIVVNIKPTAASASFDEFSRDLLQALRRISTQKSA